MNNTDLIFDITGWLGAAAYLIPYFLLVTNRMRSSSITYHLLNMMGSILLIINTAYYGAIPSAFTNGVWGGIALYGWWNDNNKSRSKIKSKG